MNARRVAWVVLGATLAMVLAGVAIDQATNDPGSGWEYLFLIGGVASFATVGALITSRQRGNRIGVLFSIVGGSMSIGITAGSYVSLASDRGLSLKDEVAWISSVGFVVGFGALAFLFLLFPTGQPSTKWWRRVYRVMIAGYVVAVVTFALTPGVIESGFVDRHAFARNPFGPPMTWRPAIQGVTFAGGLTLWLGALLSVVSLVQRFRRAGSDERQKIRWLAYLAAFLGVFVVVLFTLELTGVIPEDDSSVIGNIGFFVLISGIFFGIPGMCAIAILRYRLYELDVVVKKAVVAFLLVAVITAVALLVAIGIPLVVIGAGADSASTVAVAAGVAIGLAMSLLRRRARRWADRIVYGKRATPYEVLTEFGGRAAQSYSTDDVLPRLAQVLAGGTGAVASRVLLRVGGQLREAARWPIERTAEGGSEHVQPVVHLGEDLGALAVTMSPSDPMDITKEKLIRDLAAQAGLVLRNVRLIEELRASRQRLVAAQDMERRRIERNIHDGAQQQLVALAVKLRLADGLVERDPGKAHEVLAQLHTETDQALEDLRDLARGIYPPLLADKGLTAALEAQSRKSAVPVHVHAEGVGRYSQDIEAAIYFSCLEALSNTAKYAEATRAEVRLEQANGTLMFSVADDGRGFDRSVSRYGTGLQGIADRIDAIGGTLDIVSAPGQGTTVSGEVPVEVATP